MPGKIEKKANAASNTNTPAFLQKKGAGFFDTKQPNQSFFRTGNLPVHNGAIQKKDDPVGPGHIALGSKARTAGFYLRHPGIAEKIGDVSHGSTNISTNASRFAQNTGLWEYKIAKNQKGEGKINNMGSGINAFRHGLWQATIRSRFGDSIAKQVGALHEENPYAINGKVTYHFEGADALVQADQTIDLLNNVIGREIGTANAGSDMKILALKVLDYFYKQGMWVATYKTVTKDNVVTVISADVIRYKLLDTDYQHALKVLETTNVNGYTPGQQLERDAEVKANEKAGEELQKKINSSMGPKI